MQIASPGQRESAVTSMNVSVKVPNVPEAPGASVRVVEPVGAVGEESQAEDNAASVSANAMVVKRRMGSIPSAILTDLQRPRSGILRSNSPKQEAHMAANRREFLKVAAGTAVTAGLP